MSWLSNAWASARNATMVAFQQAQAATQAAASQAAAAARDAENRAAQAARDAVPVARQIAPAVLAATPLGPAAMLASPLAARSGLSVSAFNKNNVNNSTVETTTVNNYQDNRIAATEGAMVGSSITQMTPIDDWGAGGRAGQSLMAGPRATSMPDDSLAPRLSGMPSAVQTETAAPMKKYAIAIAAVGALALLIFILRRK